MRTVNALPIDRHPAAPHNGGPDAGLLQIPRLTRRLPLDHMEETGNDQLQSKSGTECPHQGMKAYAFPGTPAAIMPEALCEILLDPAAGSAPGFEFQYATVGRRL